MTSFRTDKKKDRTDEFYNNYKSMTNDELKNAVDALTDAEIEQLKKDFPKTLTPGYANPSEDKIFLTTSMLNLRGEYHKSLLETAFIAWQYRALNEWNVPKNIPVKNLHEYKRFGGSKTFSREELNDENLQKRIHVREFLDHLYECDPQSVMRSSYRFNPNDPERNSITEDAQKQRAMDNREKFRKKAKRVRKRQRDRIRKCNDDLNALYDDLVKLEEQALKEEKSEKSELSTKLNNFRAKYNNVMSKIKENAEYGRNYVSPADNDGLYYTALKYQMPDKRRFQYQYYMDVNYDQLCEATRDLFCFKQDIELSSIIYDIHDTMEDAEKWRKEHEDEIQTDVHVVQLGQWTFRGAFKENRERMNFYDSNNQLLKEILDKHNEDKQISNELLAERVKKAKAKNLAEHGPMSKSAKKYYKEMGKKNYGTKGGDELIKKYIDKDGKVLDEKDVIEIPVHDLRDGGLTMKTSTIYSKAAAPKQNLQQSKESEIVKRK